MFANSRDQENSNIVLTVRERSLTVPIVSLVESEESIDVLELSGATHVLPLTQKFGEHLANRVHAGFTRANVIRQLYGLQLAEFPVAGSPFQDKAIGELALHDELGLTVVGVWRNGRLIAPSPEFVLGPSCIPVVMGTPEQIAELDGVLVIYNRNPHPVIVLGDGKVARAAARALMARGVRVHMVEKSPGFAARAEGLVDRLIVGDAAARDVLGEAGIAQAPSILLTTHDDAMNIYVTVYCRRLNPTAHILTRVTHEWMADAESRTSGGAAVKSSRSTFARITASRLLKSCATPPASSPTASRRCACSSCSRRAIRSRSAARSPTRLRMEPAMYPMPPCHTARDLIQTGISPAPVVRWIVSKASGPMVVRCCHDASRSARVHCGSRSVARRVSKSAASRP